MEPIDNGGIYKTKLIRFFDRSILIVLEKGKASSPLVSICNVLLLRGDVRLDLNWTGVSEQDLMSLVVDRLLNSAQREEIAEAICLLPNLLSEIHVDVCFRRIDDYEFIPEQSIFKLLDINLYHGWIVDPQDIHAVNAIGSKSYSVMLRVIDPIKSRKSKRECTQVVNSSVTNATTASSNLPAGRGRGDIEEAETLIRTLKLSQKETYDTTDVCTLADGNSDKITCSRSYGMGDYADLGDESEILQQHVAIEALKCNASISKGEDVTKGKRTLLCQVASRNDNDLSLHKELEPTDSVSPGKDCISDPGDQIWEDKELDYEEEDFLPELEEEKESHLMQNFLDAFPSHLTDNGLFYLTEGLKEKELCIFFRNDHFNTMFKYNGKLYLLEASETCINQENLVWSKLTACTGDPVYVNGSFEEFKAEKQVHCLSEKEVIGLIFGKDSESAHLTVEYK